MAPSFPNFVPSSRKFEMGDYPVKAYRSLSGAIVRRVFGNKQFGYTLDLEFKNIGDTDELKQHSGNVVDIINHYNDTNGTVKSFQLNDRTFDGMSAELEARTQKPHDKIKWRYAEPPKIASVHPGISTVSVKLVGELDF